MAASTPTMRQPRIARRVRWASHLGPRPWSAALALFGLAAAVSLATRGDRRPPGDLALARLLQDAPVPAAADLARLAYWMGLLEASIALVIPLVLVALLRGYRPEALLLAAAVGVRAFNPFLRAVVDSPRPSAAEIRVAAAADGHGFPSSHALGAVLLFGAVAYLAVRVLHRRWAVRAVQGLAVAAILVTGYGRVYDGVHWPSDVLGGYLWGVSALLTLIGGYRWWLRRHPQDRSA
jgi:membrane-associated phospholipid phosphatase